MLQARSRLFGKRWSCLVYTSPNQLFMFAYLFSTITLLGAQHQAPVVRRRHPTVRHYQHPNVHYYIQHVAPTAFQRTNGLHQHVITAVRRRHAANRKTRPRRCCPRNVVRYCSNSRTMFIRRHNYRRDGRTAASRCCAAASRHCHISPGSVTMLLPVDFVHAFVGFCNTRVRSRREGTQQQTNASIQRRTVRDKQQQALWRQTGVTVLVAEPTTRHVPYRAYGAP